MAGAELEQASEDAEEEEGVGRQRQQSARAGSRQCCAAEMRPATPTSGRIMTVGSVYDDSEVRMQHKRPSGGKRAPGSDTTEQSLKGGGR